MVPGVMYLRDCIQGIQSKLPKLDNKNLSSYNALVAGGVLGFFGCLQMMGKPADAEEYVFDGVTHLITASAFLLEGTRHKTAAKTLQVAALILDTTRWVQVGQSLYTGAASTVPHALNIADFMVNHPVNILNNPIMKDIVRAIKLKTA